MLRETSFVIAMVLMAGPAVAAQTGATTKVGPTVRKVTSPSVGSIGGRMMGKPGQRVAGGKVMASPGTVGVGGHSTTGAMGHPK
ncbi:MAG: hypothetical protein WBS22_01160 [Methylocystis sp.]